MLVEWLENYNEFNRQILLVCVISYSWKVLPIWCPVHLAHVNSFFKVHIRDHIWLESFGYTKTRDNYSPHWSLSMPCTCFCVVHIYSSKVVYMCLLLCDWRGFLLVLEQGFLCFSGYVIDYWVSVMTDKRVEVDTVSVHLNFQTDVFK